MVLSRAPWMCPIEQSGTVLQPAVRLHADVGGRLKFDQGEV
jgi:hypothetical protein